MRIKIEDHSAGTVRVIEYPLSVLQFVKIHFTAFGIYQVTRTGASCYDVYNAFDGAHAYTVSKAKGGE